MGPPPSEIEATNKLTSENDNLFCFLFFYFNFLILFYGGFDFISFNVA